MRHWGGGGEFGCEVEGGGGLNERQGDMEVGRGGYW